MSSPTAESATAAPALTMNQINSSQPNSLSPEVSDSLLVASPGADSFPSSGDSSPTDRHHRLSSVDFRLLSYQQCMKHQFPLLLSQLHVGLSNCDRLVQFLKKSVSLQLEFASKLSAAAAVEESKNDSNKEDGMIKHARATALIPKLFQNLVERERSFADSVDRSMIVPLQNFVLQAESKRISLIDQHNKKAELVGQKKNEIDRIRLANLKIWENVTSLKKSRDKEITKDGKAKEKTLKNLAKSLDHAKKEFSRYEQSAEVAARTIDEFRFNEMPNFLQEVEDLEMSRMSVVKKISEAFAALIKNSFESPIATEFHSLIQELFAQTDLNACIDNLIQIHGLPPIDPGVIQDLPCRSEQLGNGEWEVFASDYIIPAHAQSVDAPRASLTASVVTMEEKAKRPNSLSRMPSALRMSGDEKIPEESPVGSAGQTPEVSQKRSSAASLASVSENAPAASSPAVPLGVLAAIDDDNDPEDDDEDEEKDEKDTISSLKAGRKIKEEWVLTTVDYPPKDQKDSNPDLLHFACDDIIKILRKEVDGDPSWWFGEVVGYKRPPGKFPASLIRLIDDKPLIVDEKEEDNEKTKSLVDMIRGKVSKQKRRFKDSQFDLGKFHSFFFIYSFIN